MSNISTIKPNISIHESLRNIADEIEEGSMQADSVTVIIGNRVFNLGIFDDGDAAQRAIFDMNYGIHKLMRRCFDAD